MGLCWCLGLPSWDSLGFSPSLCFCGAWALSSELRFVSCTGVCRCCCVLGCSSITTFLSSCFPLLPSLDERSLRPHFISDPRLVFPVEVILSCSLDRRLRLCVLDLELYCFRASQSFSLPSSVLPLGEGIDRCQSPWASSLSACCSPPLAMPYLAHPGGGCLSQNTQLVFHLSQM